MVNKNIESADHQHF